MVWKNRVININIIASPVMIMPEFGNRRPSGGDEQADKNDAIGCEAIIDGVEKPHTQY